MLAYAADQRPSGRSKSPTSLLLIIGGHAVALALVLTAKMDLKIAERAPNTTVVDVLDPPPPPKAEPDPPPKPSDPVESMVTLPPPPPFPLPPQQGPTLDQGPPQPPQPPQPPISGSGTSTLPPTQPPIRDVVRTGPRFVTPDSALRPPYPLAKVRAEEEATLRLRLTIDANGRVTAVDPVGKNDPVFLESARRHILRAWRYKPALVDGVAVGSTTVISLSFRLEDA